MARRIRSGLMVSLGLILVMGASSLADDPPAGPERFLPAQDLFLYIEYDGLDDHLDAWNQTAARSILDETGTGAMILDVSRQVLTYVLRKAPESDLEEGPLLSLAETLARRGFVAASYEDSWQALILPGAGRADDRKRVEPLLLAIVKSLDGKVLDPAERRGRSITQVEFEPIPMRHISTKATHPIAWFSEQDDLILVLGMNDEKPLDAVLDAIEGKAANASDHPTRLALLEKPAPENFEPNGLFFVEIQSDADVVDLLVPEPIKLLVLPPRTIEKLDAFPPRVEGMDPNLLPPGAITSGPMSAVPPGAEVPPVAPPGFDYGALPGPVLPDSPDSPQAFPPLPEPVEPAIPPPLFDDLQEAERRLDELRALRGGFPGDLDDDDDINPLGIEQVSGRWGFQGKALFTEIQVESPVPRSGLTRLLLNQPTFLKTELPPIPAGTKHFAVVALDLGTTYERLSDWLTSIDPDAQALFTLAERTLSELAGLRVREDVLDHLGPTFSVYVAPGTKSDEIVFLAALKDSRAFERSMKTIADRINASYQVEGPGPAPIEIQKLPDSALGYQLASPSGEVFWLDKKTRPTLAWNESFLVLTLTPERASEALAVADDPEKRWSPTGEVETAFSALPDQLSLLAVSDPREGSLPESLVSLPQTAQHFGRILSSYDLETDKFDALTLIGLPRPGGFRIRFDPAQLPQAEAIRSRLFPNVLAATTDTQGLRLFSRVSLPAEPAYLPVDLELKVRQSLGGKAKLFLGASLKLNNK